MLMNPLLSAMSRDHASLVGRSASGASAAALSDFLTLRDEEFERAAQRVLAKHRELYRRLA
jgi:hypothetical protein